MYVNDNLWLAMLTFKKAQAVSGIYFTRTSCYVIGKSLCKCSVSSVTKVCCCSFFLSRLDKLQCFNARTTWHVGWNLQAGKKSQMSKTQLLWEFIVWCMRPPKPFPRHTIKKMQLIHFTVPLRRHFTCSSHGLRCSLCWCSAEHLSFLEEGRLALTRTVVS